MRAAARAPVLLHDLFGRAPAGPVVVDHDGHRRGAVGAAHLDQPVAAQAGEHVGESGDVARGGAQVRATAEGVGERGLLLVLEGVGAAEDPPGDVADLGRPWRGTGGCGVAAEGSQVGADGAAAAAVAAGLDLGEQGEGLALLDEAMVRVTGERTVALSDPM